MSSITITIKGLDEAVKKLGAARIVDFVEPAMQRSVLRLEERMKRYPPAPPRSTYVRTGTLGRRWTKRVTRTATTIQGTVGNNTQPYGPLVQSARYQTWVHRRTGWETDESAVKNETAAIVKDFERTLQGALGK